MLRISWVFRSLLALPLVGQMVWGADFLDSVRIDGELGRSMPIGGLRDVIRDYWFGEAGFSYPLSNSIRGYAQAGYAYIPIHNDPAPGFRQANGRAGLELPVPGFERASLGGGISLVMVRGDHMDSAYLSSTGESEFGWHARVSCLVYKAQAYQLGLRLHWERIWTQPVASQFIWAGVFLEVTPW